MPAFCFVVALLAAAPAPVRVTAAGLSFVNLNEREGDAYVDAFAARLGRTGQFEVITRSQVAQLLGIERQKELLGCGSDSCLAEITGALSSPFIVSGSLGKIGQAFSVSLRLIDAQHSRTVASASLRFANEERLFAGLETIADDFVQAVWPPQPRELEPTAVIVTAVTAVTAAVATGVLFGIAGAQRSLLLENHFESQAQLASAAALGASSQTAAWVCAGSAVALGVLSLVLHWALPRERAIKGSVSLTGPAVLSW